MAKKYHDVRECIETYVELEGELSKVISRLQASQIEYHREGYFDLELEREYGDEYISDKWQLYGRRKETDKERNKRLADAKKARDLKATQKHKKEAVERAELERLKKKYEG